jgi:CheY-like chemotaxis protein
MPSLKILIVDDSKTIRMQVRDMLPRGSYEVIEARDGVEGLHVIRQERPNLVLLDFFMPRMNGWEVVQSIQADPRLKSIPIVMMSGRREDVEKTVPELFDYFEFVGKPFGQSHLFNAIRSATAKAKDRQEVAIPMRSPAEVEEAPADSTTIPNAELQQLKAEVQQLRNQNARLRTEVETLKKQMAQVVALVRQKLG